MTVSRTSPTGRRPSGRHRQDPPIGDQLGRLKELLGETVLAEGCPSRFVLNHVTSKWGVLVVVALAEGTRRWGELRRAVDGISEKMLAQTLRTLERDGLVRREALPVVPPHVEYSLTELGQGLVERLLPLVVWAAEQGPTIQARWDAGPPA